jgi:predicted metal-dependent hydrolase
MSQEPLQPSVTPHQRDLHFDLPPDRICDWHPVGRHASLFFGALSLFFPEGERMFIHAVRSQRDRVRTPSLREQVTGFIGQEAMHGREHQTYNDLLKQAGLPAEGLERWVYRDTQRVRTTLPAQAQLAITLALEHWTAMLAHVVLSRPEVLAGADPAYANLWRWHALEETEHKAVAFDVYREVFGSGLRAYLIRILFLLSATLIFWTQVIAFHIRLVAADGGLFDLRGWWRLFKFQWISPGVMRRVIPEWLAYFRPGFHPWQQDNRSYLSELDRYAPPKRPPASTAA